MRSIELLTNQVMMHFVGRLARLGDQKFFLGRVIERMGRGYSNEENPKYIRDVIAVLVLEDSRPVAAPCVQSTPTTESLVELENEKRAMRKTVSLSSAEAELYALTTGIAGRMVKKHILEDLGYEVNLVNHVDSQSAKAWASNVGWDT